MKIENEPTTRELPDLIAATPARSEMESVTEVNGTVARFEMAYSPATRGPERFGPPMRQRVGSMLFLAFGLGVAWGYHPVADLQAAGAVSVIDDFGALMPALRALWPKLKLADTGTGAVTNHA